MHNEVNKSLRKQLFDCSKIGDFYDCGCADDDEKSKVSSEKAERRRQDRKAKLTVEEQEGRRHFDDDYIIRDIEPPKLEKEG